MSSVKTVSINDVLSIMGRGLEIRSYEMVDQSDMRKIKKIARLFNIKPASWESLSEAVALPLNTFISKNADTTIYSYKIQDPTRWNTGYEVVVYKVGDKYIVYYQMYSPAFFGEKYIVVRSPRTALKKAIGFLEDIIDEIASVYNEWVSEDLYRGADYAIAEIKDEIKYLKEKMKQL